MIRNHSRTENRSAFTIVELLVVILIIVALAGMLFAGVMKVLGKIPETQTNVEIGELGTGLAGFMGDYRLTDPPPSQLYISENGSLYAGLMSNPATSVAATQTVQFLKQWLGGSFLTGNTYDWNGNGTVDPPYLLTGQQCLVFYLGGIPTYAAPGVVNGMSGFSPNVSNPALPAVAGTRRNGPYFNFASSRLLLVGSFPVYLDPWQVKNPPTVPNPVAGQPPMLGVAHPNGTAYAYFSTQGKINGYNALDCGLFAYPYYEVNAAGTFSNYTYNNRYQIISAGKDGVFGGGINPSTSLATTPTPTVGMPWSSASGATGYGADDQANFSSGLLGTGQH